MRTPAALHSAPCTVQGRAATCGTLTVPENRLTGEGRTIPVNFVVIPATGPKHAPDPLVWFAGGPGDAAVTAIPNMLSGFREINTDRDLVFIDQRGTGGSNRLECPEFPSVSDKPALRKAVASCLQTLPADLRFYTTAMFVDDVDQVLRALHYTSANLMGISYGATAEQVFLLRHPSSVRTMTLLSGSPLDIRLLERLPANGQAALERVFARCDAELACHRAFPKLADDWTRVWSSLTRGPWVVPASRSPSGEEIRLDTDQLTAWMRALMRNSVNAAQIPLLVHTLGANADRSATRSAALVSITKALVASGETLGSLQGESSMIGYPITCNEPWESYRPEALADQRDSFEYRSDVAGATYWKYVCTLMPTPPAAAVGAVPPVPSSVPVLTLNGSADPLDPPANLVGARRLWPNVRQLVEPGQGHDLNADNWDVCLTSLTARFIATADGTHLDAGCLDQVVTKAFTLSLASLGGS